MKVFYLKDKENGYIVNKFEMEVDYIFQGVAYDCVEWNGETKEPLEWQFHSEVYSKWDGCSHWWFKGEDYNKYLGKCNHDNTDSYYHICSSFNGFIITMCFIWKLAGNYYKNKYKELSDSISEEYDLDIVDYMLKDFEILEKEVK